MRSSGCSGVAARRQGQGAAQLKGKAGWNCSVCSSTRSPGTSMIQGPFLNRRRTSSVVGPKDWRQDLVRAAAALSSAPARTPGDITAVCSPVF